MSAQASMLNNGKATHQKTALTRTKHATYMEPPGVGNKTATLITRAGKQN